MTLYCFYVCTYISRHDIMFPVHQKILHTVEKVNFLMVKLGEVTKIFWDL
uniref:Uncharacterized protein n=1 Tax=Anguilla anguilla TaxID=7936 RepID=A0A0E9X9X4_ANGAN